MTAFQKTLYSKNNKVITLGRIEICTCKDGRVQTDQFKKYFKKIGNKPLAIKDTKVYATALGFCPFHYSQYICEKGNIDLILSPFDYVVSETLR